MKTLEHIKVGNEKYDISVADADLCAITLKGVQYIVPYPIAKLISDLAEQIGKEQERRRKDDDEILEFIKKHRRGTYITLLTENRLNEHLHSIDVQAHKQIDLHIAQMATQMGVTEELKASDSMRWAQMMNNIKASAEEIVLKEVIYK